MIPVYRLIVLVEPNPLGGFDVHVPDYPHRHDAAIGQRIAFADVRDAVLKYCRSIGDTRRLEVVIVYLNEVLGLAP